MLKLLLILPFAALALSLLAAVRSFKKTGSRKRAVMTNLAVFAVLFMVSAACPLIVKASEQNTVGVVAAGDTEVQASGYQESSSYGMGMIAAALATGLAGIGGGIAVASAAPAAIGATSEDPKNFGKSLIFVALGEGIALYGLLVSILIIFTKL